MEYEKKKMTVFFENRMGLRILALFGFAVVVTGLCKNACLASFSLHHQVRPNEEFAD